MCEKVKAKQISLCWRGRGGLQQEVYATKKVLESRVSSFQGGGRGGGCSKGGVSLVFHDMHIPRSPVHRNTGVGLVP